MGFPGKIAVMGGGSWATALAKLLLQNEQTIMWYMRRDDRIADFMRMGHNPTYLSDIQFDTSRIEFSSDINYVCSQADTLLLAMPSPYIKEHLKKITVDLSGKNIVSAVKGIVPDENAIVTNYMTDFYGIDPGFAAAVCMVTVFCGVVNCPLASIILAVEVFNSSMLVPITLPVVICYMLSGQSSLYSSQTFVESKLRMPNPNKS